jgi:hypothetical protein
VIGWRPNWDAPSPDPSNGMALLAMVVLMLVIAFATPGCAIGRVTTPAGATVEGYTLGNSFMEACMIPPPSDEGPMPKECATIKASTVTSVGEILGAAIAGGVAYFTSGMF